ncbi:hypothetical protein ACHAWF_009709 [Thalassiosira exigua]
MATGRSLSADAARERFEARLRRKAESGGEPAPPPPPSPSPADAAREWFEDRLRRKADSGAAAAAAAAAANVASDASNGGCERPIPTADGAAKPKGRASELCEALEDLRRVERERGSHPRISRAIESLSSFLEDILAAEDAEVDKLEGRPLLEGHVEMSSSVMAAEGQDLFVENDRGSESRGTSLDSSRAEESLDNYNGVDADDVRSSAEISQRNGLDTCPQGGGAVDRGGTRGGPSQRNGSRTGRSTVTLSARVRSLIYGPSTSIMQASVQENSLYHVRATLVEDEDGEVYMAERVGFWDRKAKRLACAMCAVVAILTVSLSLALTDVIDPWEEHVDGAQPSLSPTFDPRPTLEIVQERGYVRCGLDDVTLSSGDGFTRDLCRSIAAVVLGNPDSFLGVEVTEQKRWIMLRDGAVDLLINDDTHTIAREVRERSAGVGFAFSSPYHYDGMVYSGNATFVKCAEESKRYDECSSLSICVEKSTTHYDFVRRSFPSEYFKVASTRLEILELLQNRTCNVVAKDRSFMQSYVATKSMRDMGYVIGKKLMTEEPLAMVTRNTDRMWSDTVNWVIQALIYAEEQGLTKDSSRCQLGTTMTLKGAADLDFMNAVYCVGNYDEQYGVSSDDRGMNQINNGTGMIYAIPFEDLDQDGDDFPDPPPDSKLSKVRQNGSFNCGVVVPDDFEGNVAESNKLVGMSVDYCRTISAALFNGDSDSVNFVSLQETNNNPYAALANGTIDVLVGGKIQRKYDFGVPPSLGGLHYSAPYYFGDEAAINDVSFYAMATREEDVQFSSFVNMIVLATIYAQYNGITKDDSIGMPLVSLFGPSFYWSLRDAISYSGNYDEIYWGNFRSIFGTGYLEQLVREEHYFRNIRGRNILNQGL